MINYWISRIKKGIVTVPIETVEGLKLEIEKAGFELRGLITKKFGRSLTIREVDTGSCNACESEIISCTNPIYDIQRFGIDFSASPRHADALMVTGPLSKNMVHALKDTFEAMPQPKFVIALGDCAINGGVFKGSYYTEGGIKNTLPVALAIPGCPPEPIVIIKSLLALLNV
jgi:Ni,Fe-hydrogenase III small subunit